MTEIFDKNLLTLKDPFISESCIEIKIESNFFFTFLRGASKGFMKAFKAFIKLFKAPQSSVKIKIQLNFFTLSGIGTRRVQVSNASIKYVWYLPEIFSRFNFNRTNSDIHSKQENISEIIWTNISKQTYYQTWKLF